MALPRRASRAITVDGQTYRWLVTPVDGAFVTRLVVQQERGGRLIHARTVYRTSEVPPVPPGRVAGTIRRAIRAGWRPGAPGPDFELPHQPRHTYTPPADGPASGTRLISRIDVDPLRSRYPWTHHHNLFVDARLHGQISEKSLGSIFAG